MRLDIEFQSEGHTLRGWLFKPQPQAERAPVVVMAHGFSAVKEQYLDRYAQVFAQAGMTVLVYDNANFGASDGPLRQEIDPVLQRRGYRDAITFAQSLQSIDPERVGLWGTSYSGGHAIEVAALDARVRCVVAQVPTISGFRASQRRTRSDLVPQLLSRFDADRAARFRGEAPAVLPAVSSDPGKACAMSGADAYAFFTGTAAFAPSWRNEVTLRSLEMARENEPGAFIARVSPRPLLMIVAENDALTPTDICLEAFQRALPPKHLVILPGGHFDPYVRHFERSSTAACDWFKTHLLDEA